MRHRSAAQPSSHAVRWLLLAVGCVLALAAEQFEGREEILLEGAVAAAGLAALPLAKELATQIGPGAHYVDAQLLLAHVSTLMRDSEAVEHALVRPQHRFQVVRAQEALGRLSAKDERSAPGLVERPDVLDVAVFPVDGVGPHEVAFYSTTWRPVDRSRPPG